MLRLAGIAVIVGAFFALTAAGASAKVVFPKLGEIHAGSTSESFKSESVAVDDHNGHVYIADSGEHVVRDYSSAADTVSEVWNGGTSVHGGGTPAGAFAGNLAVAVDDASGDVYVSDSSHSVIDKFDQEGDLIASFGDTEVLGVPAPNGQLAGIKTPAGSFSPATAGSFGIAVDQATGDLYAIDAGHEVIDIFSSEGVYLKQIAGEPAPFGCEGAYTDGIAVDDSTGDLLISDSCDLKVYAFGLATGTLDLGFGDHLVPVGEPGEGEPAPDGTLSGRETPGGSFSEYVSVAAYDADGAIYVTDAGHEAADRYQPGGTYSGLQIQNFPGEPFGGVAVDQATGSIFIARNTGRPGPPNLTVGIFGAPVVVPAVTTKAAEVHTVTTATLNGEVNPDELPVTGCFFEYGETTAYGETALCGEDPVDEIGEGNTPVAVKAELTGLTPGTTYHYRLVASNTNGANNESGDQVLFTGASIDTTSASGVSATAATLETELNPHGLATTYRLEYDTAPYTEGGPAHGTATPTESAGSGATDVTRTAPVQGLAPDATYHFRVVAANALGTTTGPDRSFTTQGAAATLLPDSRAWELVSPPDKHGAPLESLAFEGGVIQAAADGSALAYISNGPVGTEAEGNRSVSFSQLLARREGPGTWSTRDISTPHQDPAGVVPGALSEYRLFSTDLSSSVVEPFGATPLGPSATGKTPYLRSDFAGSGSCTGDCYRPLVTGCPETPQPCPPAVEAAANVPLGTKFGELQNTVTFVTATSDQSHVLLKSPAALVPGFENAGSAVFEWTAGTLAPVSVFPDGSAAAPAGVGNQSFQVRNAISADGSRVVFEAGSPSSLYLRANVTATPSGTGACDEAGRACTIDLDAAEPSCLACESGGGKFQIASADDSRIFFTDAGQLTSDSTTKPGSPDLYLCQIEEPQPGHLTCHLTDLTVNTVDPAEPAAVQGDVIAAAADGSSVYFVAQAALTEGEGAVHGDCSAGDDHSGECNLYRYDVATASTRLVAVLSGFDYPDWRAGGGRELGELTARVSPNGRYLAFMSQRPLTGYDNRDAKTNVRDQEVYVYDSAAAPGIGLACASCNPTGARPHGVFDEGKFPGLLVDRAGSTSNWIGQTLAANIPGWTQYALGRALYQSRYLSNSGRLFFNAADALVPSDTNGTFDVYEFEYPQGPGQPESNSCTTTTPTYSPRSGGCVSLISSGTSPEESAFLDASETGNDVFFLTASRLTAKDEDKALDIYDARVGGGEPEALRPVECSGDACQQPAVPPVDATPGSLTFNGAGNVVQCPKGKVKKSGKCVKKSPPKKKHKGHKKNKHNKVKKSAKHGGGK